MTSVRMPGAANCSVAEAKIREYLLNVGHRDGKSKAKFFIGLGFSVECWTTLRDALQQHPVRNALARMIPHPYGRKFEVTCTVATPNGRNPCIVTVWMEDGPGPPRLVTAYPRPTVIADAARREYDGSDA